MQIAVLHYHFRPGGVRRVIDLGLPAIARAMGVSRLVLASGEEPDMAWRAKLEALLFPCAAEWIIEPGFGYWSEQSANGADVRAAVRAVLGRIASSSQILWAHNLGVGRNMLLTQEIARLPDSITVWLHHHDWWWDGRWERWPEMAAQGIHSLEQAVRTTLPSGSGFKHFCVNAADTSLVTSWTGIDVCFLPNPMAFESASAATVEDAREFLRRFTAAANWWIYPCRGLRRKNLAEALLVQRWIAPEAVTVTTGGPSSPAEQRYFLNLANAASYHQWPLYPGICSNTGFPEVHALLGAADVVVATSLKEGFGFTFHEAAAAGRPLFARIPQGLDETLRALGCNLPHAWRELKVPTEFYDRAGERVRVTAGWQSLQSLLPEEFRGPTGWEAGESSACHDFGRLTLAAQLEVLSHSPEALRRALQVLNPELKAGPWTVAAPSAWFPDAWAEALIQYGVNPATQRPRHGWPAEAAHAITPLFRRWLAYPLLWEDGPLLSPARP